MFWECVARPYLPAGCRFTDRWFTAVPSTHYKDAPYVWQWTPSGVPILAFLILQNSSRNWCLKRVRKNWRRLVTIELPCILCSFWSVLKVEADSWVENVQFQNYEQNHKYVRKHGLFCKLWSDLNAEYHNRRRVEGEESTDSKVIHMPCEGDWNFIPWPLRMLNVCVSERWPECDLNKS